MNAKLYLIAPLLFALTAGAIAQSRTQKTSTRRPAPSAKAETQIRQTTPPSKTQKTQPETQRTGPFVQKKKLRTLEGGKRIVANELKVTLREPQARGPWRDAAGKRVPIPLAALTGLHPAIVSIEGRHTSVKNWLKGEEIPESVRTADGTVPATARRFNVILAPDADAVTVRDALRQHPDVERVDLKTVEKCDVTPNDTSYGQLWAPPNIGLDRAWEVPGRGSVRVAVIDTGVQRTHEEFVGRVVFQNGYADFDSGDPPREGTDYDHGTHVAGIICATRDNGVGVAGYSNQIELMILNCATWSDDEKQWLVGDYDDAMDDAVENGANIINCSFGFGDEVEDEVRDAYGQSRLVVHSAGNDSRVISGWEAVSETLLTVTATMSDGTAPFNEVFDFNYSNFGPGVDLAAPGTSIWSTVGQAGYAWKSGTSMAAPQVAGAAAYLTTLNPGLLPDGAVRHLLIRFAGDAGNPGWDTMFGHGVLRLPKEKVQPLRDATAFVSSASLFPETGGYENPWQTIPSALAHVPDGATLVLNAGIYDTPVYKYPPQTISKACTLTAIPDRPAVIGAP